MKRGDFETDKRGIELASENSENQKNSVLQKPRRRVPRRRAVSLQNTLGGGGWAVVSMREEERPPGCGLSVTCASSRC